MHRDRPRTCICRLHLQLQLRQPAQPAHEPQSNLAIGRPSPQPVAPPAAVRRGSTPTDLLAAARYLGQHQRHEEISQSAQWPRPQRLHNKLVARGVSPFDFDVLLFPIHSPGHWTFAAIHSRLERSWPRFSAGSSSSAGNATFPQTTPPPGRLHRPPDALPQANGPQHPDPAPELHPEALPPQTDVPSAYTPWAVTAASTEPRTPSLPPRYHPLLHRGDLIQSLLIFGLSPLGYRP
eukprot:tig00021350_g20645.t1